MIEDTQAAQIAAPAPQAAVAQKASPLLGYVCAGLGAALFSSKAIFVKFAYAEGLDAARLLALRMVFSSPVFVAVAIWAWGRRPKGGLSQRTLLAACGVGVLGYFVSSWLDFKSLEYISAHLERMILMTYPMFVIFFGALFFKTPLRLPAIGAAVLSYVGLAILILAGADMRSGGANVGLGAALVFVAGITYALYQLFSKDLIGALGSALFTAVAMTAASIVVVGQFALTHPMSDLAVSPKALLIAFELAMVATVAPVFLMSAGIKYAGPQATAIIGTASPLFTIIMSIWLLHEPFGWIEALGSAIVVSAIGFFTYWDVRRSWTR